MKHFLFFCLAVLISLSLHATQLTGFSTLDKDYIRIHFKDGDVEFLDDASGSTAYGGHTHEAYLNSVVLYGEPLNVNAAMNTGKWLITSYDDDNYMQQGQNPVDVFRKSKLNGHAEFDWSHSDNDYVYEHTMEHIIYLKLPFSLINGSSYTLEIDAATNTDVAEISFTFDIFHSPSEAIKINLVGYTPDSSIKAADLYYWMGDGGPRDYGGFEGNKLYLYNIANEEAIEAGTITFWKSNQNELGGYNFTRSDVWLADFTGIYEPGHYRLAIEGIGCSQDFEIRDDIFFEPFRVSVLGFFYMRIGQDSIGISPVPRRPLYIPGKDPAIFRVLITDMHPWRPEWPGPGDRWDQPGWFSNFTLDGNPENPYAYGGHSDALDWDRHLGHVSIIWDMLLPYIITGGMLDNDDLGIAESGNGIPDIIDEARNEVDFFLRLRYGAGYAHGLTNPLGNFMYQAGNTPLAAWANAMNSAMLAEAFRISGHQKLMEVYADSAIVAFNYANALEDSWLNRPLDVGEGYIKGVNIKASAAAFLYNITSDTMYEDIMAENINITSPESHILVYNSGNPYGSYNNLYGVAAYLMTPNEVNYPGLFENMKVSIINKALEKEVSMTELRPSRRASDANMGYFQTIQNVHRTILAHAITDDQDVKQQLHNALLLEASWSLGRNPLNIIQMTTATTPLAAKRSIENCYTSGRNDGTPGLHPGHTPYLNMHGWDCSMTMGCPPLLQEKSYPQNQFLWPHAELYFNTRFVWAHSEFTPQQTMRGKMALYAYLYALSGDGNLQPVAGDPGNPFHPNYKISGRVDLNREGGPVMYYAGSFINVNFEGTSLKATFKDIESFEDQHIGFMINNEEPIYKTLAKNTTATFEIASGLDDIVHDLIIFKLDNPGGNTFGLQFRGLSLDAGKGILPGDGHYNLKLEFYGDSFTAGSESGPGGEDNGWFSFANVCARILRADIHNNGIGGLAVLNNTGWYQEQTTGLETTFDKLDPGLFNDGGYSQWDFSQYKPDIIVFGFGINDHFGNNNAFDNPEEWMGTYMDIIKSIADAHGNNPKIIVHPANLYNLAYVYGPKVVNQLRSEGYDAYWFRFSFDIITHPSLEEANQMGDELAAFIRQSIRSIDIRRVLLDKNTIHIGVNQYETLTAEIQPANTTFSKKVTWSSDDDSIATVDENGTVRGVSGGVTMVRATTVEGNKTANCSVFVTESTDVSETKINHIRLFPNPLINNQLNIDFGRRLNERIEINIYCQQGQLYANECIRGIDTSVITMSTQLKPGVYVVEVKSQFDKVKQKLVVL